MRCYLLVLSIIKTTGVTYTKNINQKRCKKVINNQHKCALFKPVVRALSQFKYTCRSGFTSRIPKSNIELIQWQISKQVNDNGKKSMKCIGSFRNNKLIVGHSVSQHVVMYAYLCKNSKSCMYVQKTKLLHRPVAKLVY